MSLLDCNEDDVEVGNVFGADVVERGIEDVEEGVRVDGDPATENNL